ncbi:PTS mannitol transporter subunit IIB [Candidatus Epulonipiscium fishelsonii]|uniref:PTS mannitol transporter subunit IIB n=1 Tax=Candidatus Epulonipiscium fishelsonii TaxID=77094 RepID=A0ACC8XG26_9FIRM|nr:PTS mannitol transporter subunit IIB [Epulopiscium sp. SCG-B05WGA-EpuloA1]ONI42582.1 PTS mannitol transporter subunit IIB [Epulopiscium sp. SCG-B11WGA-EpuloA1]
MKTIMAVCGSGLGSSFMVEMSINDILKEAGISGYQAAHNSLADASPSQADIFVVAADLAPSAEHLPNLIVLNSLIDRNELKDKLLAKIN